MPPAIDEPHVHHTILGMLRGVKSASLRDDLYQSAWLAVLQAAKVYDQHPEWGSWNQTVHRVCRWAILNGLRQHRVRPLCEAMARDARRTPSADATLDAAVYLAVLDEQQRQIIELRFRDDLTLKEIGQRMGVTRQTIEQRIGKAVDTMRRVK